MKKVTILALESASMTTISGPMDVFNSAGRFFNRACGEPASPYFEVEIVSQDGQPVTCFNNVAITPHRSMAEVEHTDLILISAIWDIENALARNQQVVDWLLEKYYNSTHIAGLCTGSFILASTGLLDGKDATTHWGTTEIFRQLYPEVNLKPERLITDAGDLFCSGAFNACIDLSLYLISKFISYEVAAQNAKALIHDIERISQPYHSSFNFQKNHNDEEILRLQRLLEKEYAGPINLDKLAQQEGMSRRTFDRRFKYATGDSPLVYVQRVRVEAAKRMLETENNSFDLISYQVGYEDASFFRKIFIKHTGFRPGEYRTKFQKSWDFRS